LITAAARIAAVIATAATSAGIWFSLKDKASSFFFFSAFQHVINNTGREPQERIRLQGPDLMVKLPLNHGSGYLSIVSLLL